MEATGANAPRGRVVVLCPMQIEHRAVARALRSAGLAEVAVIQTGIGKDAVVGGVEQANAIGRPASPPPGPLPPGGGGLVILAGACGALASVEDVPRIGRVIDEHGRAWSTGDAGVTLIGVDWVVSTPADKHALARQTGAAIVDMESHAFIDACERRGLAWAVVRGVSDTPDETLPAEVLRWVTPRGDTRVGAAVCDLVRRPRLVGHIVPVVRRSNRVLPQVGRRVAEIARAWSSASHA